MEVGFLVQHPAFDLPFTTTQLTSWIFNAAKEENKIIQSLQYLFISDEDILNVNTEFLQHDYFTDIITFNYNSPFSISGEIYISVDTMKANAESYNSSVENEFLRLIIHGLLHLIGYNDATSHQKETMRQKENYFIKQFFQQFV